MKKCLTFLMAVLSLCSCNSVYYSPIEMEQMYPASLHLPASLQKVGVIDRVNMQDSDMPENPFSVHSGRFTEDLATQLADADYFEDVILCDSDVSKWERTSENALAPLSQQHVQELCEDLGVEMLVSTERCLAAPLAETSGAQVQAQTVLRLYTPNRNRPFKTILLTDSLAWDLALEGMPLTVQQARRDIENYMAQKNAHYLVPYWQTVERIYFSAGNVDLRDAKIFVDRNEWEKAGEIWKQAQEGAKGKLKLQYEFNLVLYEEMIGNVQEAKDRCEALRDKVTQYADLYLFTTSYLHLLQERLLAVQNLNLQLRRFE